MSVSWEVLGVTVFNANRNTYYIGSFLAVMAIIRVELCKYYCFAYLLVNLCMPGHVAKALMIRPARSSLLRCKGRLFADQHTDKESAVASAWDPLPYVSWMLPSRLRIFLVTVSVQPHLSVWALHVAESLGCVLSFTCAFLGDATCWLGQTKPNANDQVGGQEPNSWLHFYKCLSNS